ERDADPPRQRTGVQQGDPADGAPEARDLEDRDGADEAVAAPEEQIPEDRVALEAEWSRELDERSGVARDAERDDLVPPRLVPSRCPYHDDGVDEDDGDAAGAAPATRAPVHRLMTASIPHTTPEASSKATAPARGTETPRGMVPRAA